MRTTIDIDDSVLRELKRLQERKGETLGRLVSDLLAVALAQSEGTTELVEFDWVSRSMGARVDLENRDALLDALDDDPARATRST